MNFLIAQATGGPLRMGMEGMSTQGDILALTDTFSIRSKAATMETLVKNKDPVSTSCRHRNRQKCI